MTDFDQYRSFFYEKKKSDAQRNKHEHRQQNRGKLSLSVVLELMKSILALTDETADRTIFAFAVMERLDGYV